MKKHWLFIILCIVLAIYLGHQAFDDKKWNGWVFGSAQTLLTSEHWAKDGFIKNKFVFIPFGYSTAVSYFDDAENKTIDITTRKLYHYPTGYIIPYALLMKAGIYERPWFNLLAIFFSLSALILLYSFFYLISKNVFISFFAILYYAISAQFLVFADSLANQPIDDLFRALILVLSILAIRSLDNPKKYKLYNIAIWLSYFLLSISSYDSTLFIFVWLVGLDIILSFKSLTPTPRLAFESKRVSLKKGEGVKEFFKILPWRKWLFFASAPILAFGLQMLQNWWYLGLSGALWDIKNIFEARTTVGPGTGFIEQHIRAMFSPLAYMTAMQVRFSFFIVFILLGGLWYLNKKNSYNFNGLIFIVLTLAGLIAPSIFLTMAYLDYSGRWLAPALGLLIGYATVAAAIIKKNNKLLFLTFILLLSILWFFQIYRTVIYVFNLPSNYAYRHTIHYVNSGMANFYKEISALINPNKENVIFYIYDYENIYYWPSSIFKEDVFVEAYYAKMAIVDCNGIQDFSVKYAKAKQSGVPFGVVIISLKKDLAEEAARLQSLPDGVKLIEGKYVIISQN